MKLIHLIFIILISVSLVSAACDDEINNINQNNDLSFSMNELKGCDLGNIHSVNLINVVNADGFDKSKLTALQLQNVNEDNLQMIINEGKGDITKSKALIDAYTTKALGKNTGSIIINQPGATVKAGSNSLTIKYGSSPEITVSSDDQISSLQTLTSPEKHILIKTKDSSIALKRFSSTSNIQCEFTDRGLELSEFAGTSFPPIKTKGTLSIYNEDNSLLIEGKRRTIEIQNADKLNGDIEYSSVKGIELNIKEVKNSDIKIGLKGEDYTINPAEGTENLKFSITSKGTVKIDGDLVEGSEIKARKRGLVLVNSKLFVRQNSIKGALAKDSKSSFVVTKLNGQKTTFEGEQNAVRLKREKAEMEATQDVSDLGSSPEDIKTPDQYITSFDNALEFVNQLPTKKGDVVIPKTAGDFVKFNGVDYFQKQGDPTDVYTSTEGSSGKLFISRQTDWYSRQNIVKLEAKLVTESDYDKIRVFNKASNDFIQNRLHKIYTSNKASKNQALVSKQKQRRR